MNASEQIDQYLAKLGDWRGDYCAQLRQAINASSPDLTETWKWNCPVWASAKGNVCSIGAFKDHIKVTFFKGAELDDTDKLFNAGLDAKGMRSIDFRAGDELPLAKLQALVQRAVAR